MQSTAPLSRGVHVSLVIAPTLAFLRCAPALRESRCQSGIDVNNVSALSSQAVMPTAAELALQKKYAELRAKKQKVRITLVHVAGLTRQTASECKFRRWKSSLHLRTRRRSKQTVTSKVQQVVSACASIATPRGHLNSCSFRLLQLL